MIFTLNFFIVLLSFAVFGVASVSVYYLILARQKLTEKLFKKYFTNIIVFSLLFTWFILMEGIYRMTGIIAPSIYDFPLILTALGIAVIFFFIAKESKEISDTFGFGE